MGAVAQYGCPALEVGLRRFEVEKTFGGKSLGGSRKQAIARAATQRLPKNTLGDLGAGILESLLDVSVALLQTGRPDFQPLEERLNLSAGDSIDKH